MKLIKCPLCDQWLKQTEMSKLYFPNDLIGEKCFRLINHYRHAHIPFYSRIFSNIEIKMKAKTDKYKQAKHVANEQAKKELIEILKQKGINKPIVERLLVF